MDPENITVILVSPENVDNIGAVARAIKNTGFFELRLIHPPKSWRTKGKKMAMSAQDVLKKAQVFSSLKEATHDLHWVIGTTRRNSRGRGFFLPFPEALKRIRKMSSTIKTGIIFGCESKGLANKDIALCDKLVTIPSSPAYPSLNLAQAVMVTLFALFSPVSHSRDIKKSEEEKLLNKQEVRNTLCHFEKALRSLGYRKGGANLLPRILHTFQGLIKRSGLLEVESQMIKGLSRKIREKV